jgi:hypothetical protein
MKKIYLHIGAGKTGTSALQSLLSLNREKLYESGYYYPESSNDNAAKKFKITSGNAIQLGKILRKEKCPKEDIAKTLTTYIEKAKGKDIIFSSEVLEMYNPECAQILKDLAKSLGYKIFIIYYVRAICDHLVSSYHQLLKRHDYTHDFSYFIKKNTNRFLSVIEKSIYIFGKEHVIVKNYDLVKKYIFADFLQSILKIESINNFTMSQQIVNRSLTQYEVVLLRYINMIFKNKEYSTYISNILIKIRPNISYDMHISKEDLVYIKSIYVDELAKINTYLPLNERPLLFVDNVQVIKC